MSADALESSKGSTVSRLELLITVGTERSAVGRYGCRRKVIIGSLIVLMDDLYGGEQRIAAEKQNRGKTYDYAVT